MVGYKVEIQIDEQEMLEKLEMLEEIEQIGQKAIETVKRICNIPQREKTIPETLIFEALVSLPWIIKRDQKEIQSILSYKILDGIVLAEIPPYRRKEYRAKIENLELSPEMPEELRKELIPEIEIKSSHYALELQIPWRTETYPDKTTLEIEIELDFRDRSPYRIIEISLRDVLWIALTLSNMDIERVAREIMKHNKEDALLFTLYGAIAMKARQLLLSNPNLIEESMKKRAEIEMKREKELEELVRKQNIPLAWIPSDRSITLRRSLRDLRRGEDPEYILKNKMQGFNFGIPIAIDTEERRYKPYRMGKKEETKDPKQDIFNRIVFGYLGIDLAYRDSHRNPTIIWRREITVEDMLNILTNITKEDLEIGIATMKNIARMAELIAEYIEKLRNYTSEILKLYKYRREELEKQMEKTLRTITA
jgi:hypothetical protein